MQDDTRFGRPVYAHPSGPLYAFAEPTFDLPAPSSLGGIFDMFREGASLVEAASEALARVAQNLTTIEAAVRDGGDGAALTTGLAAIRRHIESAVVDGDNLLVADAHHLASSPLVVRALARDAAGRVMIRDLTIERTALVMIGVGADDPRPLDRLDAASRIAQGEPGNAAAILPALEAMATQVAAAVSRLSIIKARLALQSSFLAAVAGADVAPIVDSPRDLSDARALALQTRRLLGGQSLDIGNSNRQMLQALFARP